MNTNKNSLGIALLACVVILLLSFGYWLNQATLTFADFRKSSWVQTTGRVVSKNIENRKMRGGDDFHPVVTYQYSVKKAIYTNNVLSLKEEKGFDRAEQASHSVEKYAVGDKVSVWYDPGFPFLSALETSGSRSFLGFTFASLQFLGVISIVAVSFLEARNRTRSMSEDPPTKYTLEP